MTDPWPQAESETSLSVILDAAWRLREHLQDHLNLDLALDPFLLLSPVAFFLETMTAFDTDALGMKALPHPCDG